MATNEKTDLNSVNVQCTGVVHISIAFRGAVSKTESVSIKPAGNIKMSLLVQRRISTFNDFNKTVSGNEACRRPHPLSLVPLSTYIRYQEFGVERSFACVVIYSAIIFNNGEGLAPLPFDPIIRTPQNPKLYRLASQLDPLICWERQKLTSNEALSCEISDR
ncbi:Hypothetical predicted protein [Scomber scombrus]|uniref:Uncharacterized protein n=1 Tax=Scomber scombrus TaxID=13677 RepID=A0AAV1NCK4_SCOSC